MGKRNSFEPDGRGASDRQLLGFGLTVVAVAAVLTAGLLAKSTGRLDDHVRGGRRLGQRRRRPSAKIRRQIPRRARRRGR